MRGKLITLEGGEGAGKSTVLAAIRDRLGEHGIAHAVTREPGGTPLGEGVRELVLGAHLGGQVCAESELLLMFAARAQLVREVFLPALGAGTWIVSDRYVDASYAYQGAGRGQPVDRIAALEEWACAGVRADLTLLLDLPVEQGLSRANQRGAADRIESEQADFFERIRAGYRERAAAEPDRIRVIDSSRTIEQVRDDVLSALDAFVALAGNAA
ncbi:MAG: dTMP kinase [Dokdonella sp.]